MAGYTVVSCIIEL